jgi:signal transduction histidine kinase
MRVLVVEDENATALIIQVVLQQRGHQVVRCEDGEAAWAACQAEQFELILTDWVLPGMQGPALCRRIRGLPSGDRPFILMITGMHGREDLENALAAGASDYITKPFTTELLHVRLTIAERALAEADFRRVIETALVQASAVAAQAAAWKELSRQQHLMINLISHEFRTPLTMLLGFSELLAEREDLSADLKTQLSAIHEGAQRLHTVIGNILDFSLLESGDAHLERETLDLARCLPSWLEGLASEDRLAISVTPDMPPIQGDRKLLGEAIRHLAENGLKFSGTDRPVSVSARRVDENTVAIDVVDEGEGLPTEELDRVFDPLYRTKLAQRDAVPGVGLGLAIVRRIAQLHDGSVTVRREDGRRTQFSLIVSVHPVTNRRSGL